jgi:predicted glutamine amidotransferase
MCGIIYAKNLKDNHPVNDLVKILYENQKERGQQGFGFVGLNAERIDTYRATGERGIMKYLNECQYDEVIFHHRLPTSTQNTLKSTHPFVIDMESKRYYFVHNGIIQNAGELKEKHAKRGIAYASEEGTGFNDSEALAWDFCLWLNNQQERVEAVGSVAFICLEVDEKANRALKLYFYRNDSDRVPLKIYKDRTLFLLASIGSYPLIKARRLYFWDYQSGQIRKSKFLDIRSPRFFSFNRYDYTDYDEEVEAEAIITSLELERDHLVGVGRYSEADMIEDEIDDLKERLRKARRQGRIWTP